MNAIAHLPTFSKFFKGMETWNYMHVGTLQFVQWHKESLVNDSAELKAEGLMRLVGAIVECQFEAIAAAHSASCGGGYMRSVWPTRVCIVSP